ncbi:MAG: acyl-CoA ligase (AMP-forming), exosortase A system-associated [Gammaproteobacteria bacterium]|nr:MAG: acyl-CoA ligase (AMP-forming), exosortase A system-associated [Gammaproteobacteria bacterium]
MLLHHFITDAASATPEAPALLHKDRVLDYQGLAGSVETFAGALVAADLAPAERVAVYLPKQFETVIALFGAAAAGGVFVPVNPQLKPAQVGHILRDCNVRVLVTSPERAALLDETLAACPDLHTVVLTGPGESGSRHHFRVIDWSTFTGQAAGRPHRRIDQDLAAILYTSGSTGRPKGVVLSHRNMVAGARSVAEYLENTPEDRLLAVLPLSFDYGLSQLTTAISVGASVALMDYLLPRDVIRAVVRHRITGLAAVPPLWVQLAELEWPAEAAESLRYFTNSGGAMPLPVLRKLRAALPSTRPYLMYGLTEAFRSTYLPPEELDRRPTSMGKAIPNAEVMVVREDGSPCAPDEPGELVHRGALVAQGYWNDPERTAERFRPAPGQPAGIPVPELAVWSGDTVKRDAEGFLYFVGRRDEMIKTSGYRVSPTEVEEVAYSCGLVAEAAAVGVPHPQLGQAIVLLVVPESDDFDPEELLAHCKRELPNFMVPQAVIPHTSLPRNPNGKIDRKALAAEHAALFGGP